MMYMTLTWLYLILMVAAGIALGKIGSYCIRQLIRASDKNKIKAAMQREAYLNQLYEENLYEEMDRLARQAESEMYRASRRY